jgi:hypothetical protein
VIKAKAEGRANDAVKSKEGEGCNNSSNEKVKVFPVAYSNAEKNHKGLQLCLRHKNSHSNSKVNNAGMNYNKRLRHCLTKQTNNCSRVRNSGKNNCRENNNLEVEQMVQILVDHRGIPQQNLKSVPDPKVPHLPESSHQYNHNCPTQLNPHSLSNPNLAAEQKNLTPKVKKIVPHFQIKLWLYQSHYATAEANPADQSDSVPTFYQ